MKTEEQVRERYDVLINKLKRVDVTKKENEKLLFAIAAGLHELDWVLDG